MATPFAIALNRGSNLAWVLTLTNDATGLPVDVSSWTFPITEINPAALAATASCTVIDGPNGQAMLTIPWSDAWPDGEGRKVSIRIKPSALAEAFPEFQVQIQ